MATEPIHTEALLVPINHLGEVIALLRAGLHAVPVSRETRQTIKEWIELEEETLQIYELAE